MAVKWFIQVKDRVEGPLTQVEIQNRIQTGTINGSDLVWGSGMDQWRSISWWNQESSNVELTQTAIQQPLPETWHFALNGGSHGPYKRQELLDELKKVNNLGDVLLWTKGMKEWAPLFEFHDILSSIGVNKRQFPRADLNGQVTLKTGERTLVAQALTISEGGMGVALEEGVVSGQNVSVEIQSPAFRGPVHAKAEVRYVSDGVTGLRFTNVSQENKAAIISFVRQSQTRFVLKAS